MCKSLLAFSCAQGTRTSQRGAVQALLMPPACGELFLSSALHKPLIMHAVEGNTAIEVSAGAKYVVKQSQETFQFDILMESPSVKPRRGLRILQGQLGKCGQC